MPIVSDTRKNDGQPIASTTNPLIGPANSRGSANRLEKSAYCVAEKRFCVTRSSRTENAPVPIPDVSSSNPVAEYIKGRLGPPAIEIR